MTSPSCLTSCTMPGAPCRLLRNAWTSSILTPSKRATVWSSRPRLIAAPLGGDGDGLGGQTAPRLQLRLSRETCPARHSLPPFAVRSQELQERRGRAACWGGAKILELPANVGLQRGRSKG